VIPPGALRDEIALFFSLTAVLRYSPESKNDATLFLTKIFLRRNILLNNSREN